MPLLLSGMGESAIYNSIIKAARWFPVLFHDVTGEFVVRLHHKGVEFIASHHNDTEIKLRMHLAICYPQSDGKVVNLNGFILKRLRTVKAYSNLKGQITKIK
jgi:hypothetical protein